MNCSGVKEVLISIESAGHENFSKASFVSVVSGPAKVLFSTQRWQHRYCCFFGVLLIASDGVEISRGSGDLTYHLGQPCHFEA